MATGFLQNLSQDLGLHFEDKRLFGWVNGYHITFSIVLSLSYRLQIYLPGLSQAPSQDMDQDALQKSALLRAEAVRVLESAAKAYKLSQIASVSDEQFVAIEFRGAGKTLKNIKPFVQSAVSGIAGLGIPSVKACSYCGKVIESGEVPVRIKDDVFPMHDNCAEEAIRQQAWLGEPKKGSVPLGILGAAIAAVLGAIPWAVVLSVGYIASVVGLLIGVMVNKGYDLLHGRQGRVKIAIVLLFVILSVALGQIAGTSYAMLQEYNEMEASLTADEYMIYSRPEFLQIMWTQVIWEDSEVVSEVLGNFGMGIFFAALGCMRMFSQLVRGTAPNRPKRLTASL